MKQEPQNNSNIAAILETTKGDLSNTLGQIDGGLCSK